MSNPLARFLARPNTDPVKSVGMAGLIGAAAALIVASASVLLTPQIAANRAGAKSDLMASMLAGVPGIAELIEGQGIETHVVDLTTGRISPTDPAGFDQIAAASDPERSIALAPAVDLAALSRREKEAMVWMVREGKDVRLLILPVRGAGYQSTIRAYLALEGDLNTVAAVAVYEQGDTPGLGAKITEEAYARGWRGRKIAEDGEILIDTAIGASGDFEVEMISGASVTSYAMVDMMHFWLGEAGFGPFLANLAKGEAGL